MADVYAYSRIQTDWARRARHRTLPGDKTCHFVHSCLAPGRPDADAGPDPVLERIYRPETHAFSIPKNGSDNETYNESVEMYALEAKKRLGARSVRVTAVETLGPLRLASFSATGNPDQLERARSALERQGHRILWAQEFWHRMRHRGIPSRFSAK